MIGSDDLVAIGHIGARAKEQGPVGVHILLIPIIPVGHDLHMLVRHVVGNFEHLFMRVAQDHVAIILPRGGCGFMRRQNFQQSVNFRQSILGQFAGVGDQASGRVVTMFGLTQKISGAHLGIHCVVGNHHRFGWASKQVDPDTAKKLPLGFGDKGIAGSHNHMNRIDGLRSNSHGANRLDTTQNVNLVRSAHMHCRDNCRMRRAIDRRCRSNDARYARDLRCQHRHMSRCHHGKLTARDVTADRLHRYVLVPQNNTRKGLDLDIRH